MGAIESAPAAPVAEPVAQVELTPLPEFRAEMEQYFDDDLDITPADLGAIAAVEAREPAEQPRVVGFHAPQVIWPDEADMDLAEMNGGFDPTVDHHVFAEVV